MDILTKLLAAGTRTDAYFWGSQVRIA